MTRELKMAIPECRLTDESAGPQLRRYRELARHVARIERRPGEVRVQFGEAVPDDLLALTLAVERECCTFVDLDYASESRSLTITVADASQDPRLDSFAALLGRVT